MKIRIKPIQVTHQVTLERVRVIITIKKSILQSLDQKLQKLVLVLTTFTQMSEACKEDDLILERVSYIYYPIQFKKN